MQISHAEAHRIIQLRSDRELNSLDKELLQSHLTTCNECQRYAESLKEMEGVLVPLLRRQWNLSPAPLSLDALTVGKNKIPTGSPILATRTALIGLVCMLFLFSVWQFTYSNTSAPGLFTAAVPPIPTPSTQFTLTETTQKNCREQSYIVREDDTLESIAGRFASSKEEIMAANKMQTESLRPGDTIWVTFCTLTPTGTVNALTTTYTPSIRPTTSTPGG